MLHVTPKAITLAMGLQSDEPERIIGNTPTAAAIAVRKTGRKRRFPDSMAAVRISIP
ncbi:hypothetical protein SDC9_92530 [bioreactor metagenome]|uniref:Uncharacterized protein n=1 Tax=bioreactor metagenome TaxID=1076179 RepID=A0A644ZZG3_9ZZZZ